MHTAVIGDLCEAITAQPTAALQAHDHAADVAAEQAAAERALRRSRHPDQEFLQRVLDGVRRL